MLEVKVGVRLSCLRRSFKEALLTAARMGAKAVEIDARGEIKPHDLSRTGVRDVRKMLDDLNLRVSAVAFHTARGYDVTENLEARVDGTIAAMRFASELGCRIVRNYVGTIASDSESLAWRTQTQALADIGRQGQRIGAFLCAATGGVETADLKRLLDALPAGTLGVDFDPAALVAVGRSPADALRELGEHVLHVTTRDAVRVSGGVAQETALGRGSVDFPELLGVLEQREYNGWFTVARDSPGDHFAELVAAIEFLKGI